MGGLSLADMRPSAEKLVIAALFLAACTGPGASGTSPTISNSTTMGLPGTTGAPTPSCDRAIEFTEGGRVASMERLGSDAQTVGLISWEAPSQCETFTISFVSSEGAPATTPPSVTVDFLDPAPILRIALDATGSVIADQVVDTGLVDRLFVVDSIDGGVFIDLHLKGPAQARVSTGESPATLQLELQPGLVDHPNRPVVIEDLVLISPMEGSDVDSPVEVSGYARKTSGGLVVIATSGDLVLGEHQLEPAGEVGSWGEFRTSLALDPGPVTIFAGEDLGPGGLEGVTVQMTVG